MRRHARFPALFIAAIALVPAACSREARQESGGGAVDSHASSPADWAGLRGFTAIDATGPDNIVVTKGDFAVSVEGDPDVVKRLEIKVSGGTLEIGRKKQWGVNWNNDHGATIRVSMPQLSSVELTGSGNVDVDKADGTAMKADLTGSGDLKVAAAAVGAFTASITGSGDLSIAGNAETVDISITGSGDFDGAGLRAGGGDVSIMGSGDAGFASDGPVDISIMGSGDVMVKGKAQCKSSIMGSGEARCAP